MNRSVILISENEEQQSKMFCFSMILSYKCQSLIGCVTTMEE